MPEALSKYLNNQMQVVTSDGSIIIGKLIGYDSSVNLIISNTIMRIFSLTGTETLDLGLYVIRGDNIVLIAQVDENVDQTVDWEAVKANPIKNMF